MVRAVSSPAQSLRAVVESALELFRAHLALFKAELAADAKRYGAAAGLIVGLLPLILVGWGFLCVALALFLRRWLAADLAFLLVGLFNLAIAGGGIFSAVRRLQQPPKVAEAIASIEASRALVLGTKPAEEPSHG